MRLCVLRCVIASKYFGAKYHRIVESSGVKLSGASEVRSPETPFAKISYLGLGLRFVFVDHYG
jgi:hypothetical protein